MNGSFSQSHLHLYACPGRVRSGRIIQFPTMAFPSLECSDIEIAASSFDLSFDQAYAGLQQLERLFIEPDGAFVMSGVDADRPWQIDGMLYDDAVRIKRVELKGYCPAAAWKRLLHCFGWPTQRLLAHCIQRGCFVEITEQIDSPLALSEVAHETP